MNPLDGITTKALSYISAAVIIPLVAYSGYAYVTIADLERDLAKSTSDYSVCKINRSALEILVDEQSEAVGDMKAAAETRQKAAQEALSRARSTHATLEAEIASLRAAEGSSCADADQLMNEALGL